MTLNWAETHRPNPAEPITFVFDAGYRNQEQALIEMKKIKQIRIGQRRPQDTFAFADDRTIIQLQAADVAAYEVWQKWKKRPSLILDKIRQRCPHERYHFYPDRITTLLNRYNAVRDATKRAKRI